MAMDQIATLSVLLEVDGDLSRIATQLDNLSGKAGELAQHWDTFTEATGDTSSFLPETKAHLVGIQTEVHKASRAFNDIQQNVQKKYLRAVDVLAKATEAGVSKSSKQYLHLQKRIQQLGDLANKKLPGMREYAEALNRIASNTDVQHLEVPVAYTDKVTGERIWEDRGLSTSAARRKSLLEAGHTNVAVADIGKLGDFGEPLANRIKELKNAYNNIDPAISVVNRKIAKTKSEMTSGDEGSRGFINNIRNATSASILLLGPLSGIGARISTLGAVAIRNSARVAVILGTFSLFTLGIYKLIQAVFTLGVELDKATKRLAVTEGATVLAKEALEEVKDVADRVGNSIVITANAFSRLTFASIGTALEGQKIKEVFEDISFAIGKVQLSNEEAQGIFKAIEQIMSKGIVQAEELRGQLGDRLPGAFNIAARAMGVTTAELNKLLKSGQVISKDFLPKFSKELRKTYGAMNTDEIKTATASLNRYRNSIAILFEKINEEAYITTIVVYALDNISKAIRGVAENASLFVNLFVATGSAGLSTGLLYVFRSITTALLPLRRIFAILNKDITKLALIVSRVSPALGSIATSIAAIKTTSNLTGLIATFKALGTTVAKSLLSLKGAPFILITAAIWGLITALRALDDGWKDAFKSMKQYVEEQKLATTGTLDAQRKTAEFIKTLEAKLKVTQLDHYSTSIIGGLENTPTGSGQEKNITEQETVLKQLNDIIDEQARLRLQREKDQYLEKLTEQANKLSEIALRTKIVKAQEEGRSKGFIKGIQAQHELLKKQHEDMKKFKSVFPKPGPNTSVEEIKKWLEKQKEAKQLLKHEKDQLRSSALKDADDKLAQATKNLTMLQEIERKAQNFRSDLESSGHLSPGEVDVRVDKFKQHELKEAQKGIDKINLSWKDMHDTIAELEKSFPQLDELQKKFDMRDKVEAFRQSLIGLRYSTEEVDRATKQYEETLKQLDQAQEDNKAKIQFWSNLENLAVSSVHSIGDALAQMITGQKDLLASLGDIARKAAETIISELWKVYVTEKLIKSALFGSGTFLGIPLGDPTAGASTAPTSAPQLPAITYAAQGQAFDSSSKIQYFESGGIISSPTMFSHSKGLGVMGESGPEAVVPLGRTSSGDLGIKVAGQNAKGHSSVFNQVNNINVTAQPTGNPQADRSHAKQIAKQVQAALENMTYQAMERNPNNNLVRTS